MGDAGRTCGHDDRGVRRARRPSGGDASGLRARIDDPDIGLGIAADIPRHIDLHRNDAVFDFEVARCIDMLAAPGLPEADRLLDDHRIAAYSMDAATHGDMAAQPWIENPALVIGPAAVIVDRDFRESVLAGRPDWTNQPLQSFFDAQAIGSA